MIKIKLIINDEVNCKLANLPLEHRKALVNKFKVEVPGVRYTPAVRLGRWDGKVSFATIGGSTFINLLPQILPMLDEWKYDIEIEDNRDYTTQFTFDAVDENSFSDRVWPEGHQLAGKPIVLRDYQIKHINMFLQNTQCLQEIATGAGKTLITAALSNRCEQYGRTIVIVPNKSLVVQTEADYKNLGLDVGVFFGDRKEFGRKHTVCTWQSLNNLLKGSGDIELSEFLENVVCVLVDEVHSAKAAILKQMLTGAMSLIPIRWGLTGTIPKEEHDRLSLLCSLGEVIGELPAHELQEQGVLADCHVNIVQLVDYADFKDYQSELKYLLTDKKRVECVAKLINQIKDTGNTLVLVDRISIGKDLNTLVENSTFVSGVTKNKNRLEEYNEINIGTEKVLIATYGIAAIGINIVNLHNVVLIEPGKSFVRTIQSIGRGLRRSSEKNFVDIWDITSTCKFSKRHLAKRKEFYKNAKYEFTVDKLEY